MSNLLQKLSWTPIAIPKGEDITPKDRQTVFEAFNFDEKVMKMFDVGEKTKFGDEIRLKIYDDELSINLKEKTIEYITYSCF